MNWGVRIVVSFIVFAAVIFTMVFISMNQEINLVATDYYRQEIEYENQIQRLKNTRSLENPPEISIDHLSGTVIVKFPPEIRNQVQEGYIHMFRPSDSRLDKKYKLSLDEQGIQNITVSGSVKGLWKIKLFWKDGGLEYYMEKLLTI